MGHSQHPSVKISLDTKIPLSPQVGLPIPIGSYTFFRKYSMSMECSLAIPLSFSFLHACECVRITRALHVFLLRHNVPSLHYPRTVTSHHNCSPQYSIKEICFNTSNKLPTPGVRYSPQVLVSSLGCIIKKKLPHERTAELPGTTLDWSWRQQ